MLILINNKTTYYFMYTKTACQFKTKVQEQKMSLISWMYFTLVACIHPPWSVHPPFHPFNINPWSYITGMSFPWTPASVLNQFLQISIRWVDWDLCTGLGSSQRFSISRTFIVGYCCRSCVDWFLKSSFMIINMSCKQCCSCRFEFRHLTAHVCLALLCHLSSVRQWG